MRGALRRTGVKSPRHGRRFALHDPAHRAARASPPAFAMSRNELCACGSGKRFKHCHALIAASASGFPSGPSKLHLEALAAHKAWSLGRAEALYRQALAADPNDVESLHMLGVVHFERRRYREALECLWDAAERTGWNDATLRQNLGLLLAKFLAPAANARQEALVAAYVERERALAAAPAVAARVSVVLAVCNGAATIARAVRSVAAQTYAAIELVVVDDGASDETDRVVDDGMAKLALPARWIRGAGRGAAHAANAGAQAAAGNYVAFLHADDAFAPERLARMVAAIARPMPLWGFSQIGIANRGAASPRRRGARPRDFLAHEPPSFTMLARDVMESSGNLFIERELFLRLGGFPDVERGLGWAFAMRAARQVEPVPVAGDLYLRGDHAHAGAGAVADERRAAQLVSEAIAANPDATNEFCPQFAGNRELVLRAELRAGRGDRLPVDVLRSLAAEWRGRPDTPLPKRSNSGVAAMAQGDKAALVVLGMYRSGTSAFARALNLCGAFLPQRVAAAKLGLNPKGFWEPEAVTDLDVRLMEVLGAEWNRVGFELPRDGPLVEQFLTATRELLAGDYEDAPLIVIKDPRICVLAPLWDRALSEGGYRPAYVVTVRHPLEVAASIETQGDMAVAEGLALWLAYMRRVEAFADARGAGIVHVRYTDLLDDWRSVVRRIARRLDVPLDVDARAAEVDRFLEADMRTHRAGDDDFDAGLAGAAGDAIRTLYRRQLERCERDAVAAR